MKMFITLKSHAKVCVDLEALWGPSCYVMFLTPSQVEAWLDCLRNIIVFIKKQPRICSLDKLLALINVNRQGCQID
jgi:hypothetical protein